MGGGRSLDRWGATWADTCRAGPWRRRRGADRGSVGRARGLDLDRATGRQFVIDQRSVVRWMPYPGPPGEGHADPCPVGARSSTLTGRRALTMPGGTLLLRPIVTRVGGEP